MKKIFHPASGRGHADHGWLNAHHSFSFANWYDPSKMHFGMLRVLNDDIVAADNGFGTHPHNDMEIITIVLEGELEHKDSMGNGSVIRPGEVQVMSAGSGVYHSEFNPSKTNSTNLFQLWIFPKEKGIKPRYDQKAFDVESKKNKILPVAGGFKTNGELYIHQDAVLSLTDISAGETLTYNLNKKGNGVYVMNINGKAEAGGQLLNRRDAVGISESDSIELKAIEDSSLLLVEVPMQ